MPNRLWRVQVPLCFAKIHLPDMVQWTEQNQWDLGDRTNRRRAYEILLRDGLPMFIHRWVDGALLADLWDDLDLPGTIRRAWQPVVSAARLAPSEDPAHLALDDYIARRKAALDARRQALKRR